MKMNNEFDFNKIGKQMPYTVPDNFFDDLEKNIMKQVLRPDSAQVSEEPKAVINKPKRRFLWPTIFSAAAAIACLIVLTLKFMPASQEGSSLAQDYSPKTAQAEEAQAFDKLSTADQEYLMEVYNDDVFIEEVSN